ncbi:MAG: hypothetical protein IJ583_01935 [Firmicutes bacterium]|nr:hypothetical protein [Bacillota bacterium]
MDQAVNYKVMSNIGFEISFIKVVDEVIKKCIRVGEAEMCYNDEYNKSNVVITAKWADYPDRKHKAVKLCINNFAENRAVYSIFIKETVILKSELPWVKS